MPANRLALWIWVLLLVRQIVVCRGLELSLEAAHQALTHILGIPILPLDLRS